MKKLLPFLVLFTLTYLHNSAQTGPTAVWAGSAKSQVSPGVQLLNYPTAIATDNAGNVFVAGYFYGTVDFDFSAAGTTNLTSQGDKDIFIAKYDASGNFVWAKSFGSAGEDMAYGLTVHGANITITGSYTGQVDFGGGSLSSSSLHSAFIARFDENGMLQWVKAIVGYDAVSQGITTDLQDNVYITGYYQDTVDFDPGINVANNTSAGLQDAFIAKYNTSGEIAWMKSIGGASYESAMAINIDGFGSIYMAGYFHSNTIDIGSGADKVTLTRIGYYDCFLAKFDGNGNVKWGDDIGGDGGSNVFGRSIYPDAAGVYLSGSFTSTVDFDPSAGTAAITSAGSSDVFIAHYDATGNYGWAKNVAGSGPDECFAITGDSKNNIYITGYIGGSADFDASDNTAELFPSGFDIYLAKYDAQGNYMWARNFGSNSNSDQGSALAVTNNDLLLLAGGFTGTIDFDPGPGDKELSTNPVGVVYNGDVFVAEYNTGNALPVKLLSFTGQNAGKKIMLNWVTAAETNNEKFVVERGRDGIHFTFLTEVAGKGNSPGENSYITYDASPFEGINYYRLKQVDADGSFAYSKAIALSYGQVTAGIYPNPASSVLNVAFDNTKYQYVQLISPDGKILSSQQGVNGLVSFNIQRLPGGAYFVKLIGNSGTIAKKVIKY